MKKHHYDFAAVPIMEVGKVCEQMEDKGYEVMCVFNTGGAAQLVDRKVIDISAKPQLVPVMGILYRAPRGYKPLGLDGEPEIK